MRVLLASLAFLALAACGAVPARLASPVPGDARQLVLVTTSGWDSIAGTLVRYARDDASGAWRAVDAPVVVTIGRAGAAWGSGLHPLPQRGPVKREGDGRAPAGVFRIGPAFGYEASFASRWPYQAMDADDWCIDVPDSPLYNRIVDAREVGADAIAGSTEPMRRDLHASGDRRYVLGFVVEHNEARTPGGGSCIFAHAWKAPGEPTAGCTAMDEAALRALVAWLDPEAEPVFVLLPAEAHARLRVAWSLP